ncbi:hypothetical protein SAY87_005057 [Trapa incisa]|uniref:Uncharacterized protein n=1 Tax=Trapa incisa TaxID=236973 RepID=A0AAN7JPS2_9MYRT|nr:hypothetical protein SAY87_005057 [Trapa incisa]
MDTADDAAFDIRPRDRIQQRQRQQKKLLEKASVRQLFMLLSVSLFSLVVSGCPAFLRPFNSYITTSFLFRLLTHTVDKSCIFLICNGILVFLAKSSGLIRVGSSRRLRPSSNGSHRGLPRQEPTRGAFDYDTDERFPEGLVGVSDYPEMENGDGFPNEEEENSAPLLEQASHDEHGGDGDTQIKDQEEEKEEDNDDDDMLAGSNTEELNRKCDEFIRRMKEEIIRVEEQQQQQLVVV